MAKKIIKAHMKQRRDTKANWASVNPVLLDGELGIVSDDPNLYKVGDGATAWNDLPFRGFDGTLVHHTGTSATAVMSQKAVTDALSTKADLAGKYPQMTAGFANNLVGRGEAVDAVIDFRASGGKSIEDGAARVKELRGNTIVVDGELLSCNAEGIKSVGFNAWDEEWEQGYYDTGRVGTTLLPVASTNRFRSKNPIKVLPNTQYCLMSDMDYMVIIFITSDGIVLNEYAYGNGATFTTPADCGYLHFFTYAQVANASYTGKICINLSHSGYRNGEYQPYVQFIRDIDTRIREAFPNGMRSAGNAYDKVYNKNGKGYVEKRIGMVDLGSLEWYADSGRFNSSAIADIGGDIAYRYLNVLCRYTETMSGADKTFFVYENKQVFLYDSAYTDAASLKAALKGVPLYYELATPEIIEYDEPFNLDYTVWDFGTEQMLSTEPSAPIRARIVYGFNAVDSVRTAQLEIAELKTQIAQMQTLMASLAAQPAALAE